MSWLCHGMLWSVRSNTNYKARNALIFEIRTLVLFPSDTFFQTTNPHSSCMFGSWQRVGNAPAAKSSIPMGKISRYGPCPPPALIPALNHRQKHGKQCVAPPLWLAPPQRRPRVEKYSAGDVSHRRRHRNIRERGSSFHSDAGRHSQFKYDRRR